MNHLTRLAIKAAIDAGRETLSVFKSEDFGMRLKSDDSPLTEADLKSHQTVGGYLKDTGIPILSEEGDNITYATRKSWPKLWIVDPLDGTKEFVKRSGEFTVNIALVESQQPTMGVVFAPYLGWLYWGDASGAFKAELAGDWKNQALDELIGSLDAIQLPCQAETTFTVVASVSHFSKETELFINALKENKESVNLVSRGSSLKMCLVAEGSAHIYPRLGPTMEWDTAAGQAVIEAAGGQLFDWRTRRPMKYNREDLLNGWFMAVGKGQDVNAYWLL
jgi:3'(2'), 5'-bisphosphate nucleotidase